MSAAMVGEKGGVMRIKGLAALKKQTDKMLAFVNNEMNNLNGDEDRYEKLDEAYMCLDAALKHLKDIQEL